MLLISFTKYPNFLASKDVPFILTLSNYQQILAEADLHILDYFKNSVIIALVVTVLTVVVASFAAYAVSRIQFRGKSIIIMVILAVSMFPQISIVGYLFKIMTSLGWINTYQALIFPYTAWTMPMSLWILISYFTQLPKDLDEAAMIDGASRIQTLTRIIIPLAAPSIFSTALLVFISSFNEFMFALMLTTDYHARTIPVGIAMFQGLHGEIPWGQVMATSAIAAVPLVILTLIFQRYIVQGLTAGALKD
ncbi:sugar ABC transporter permease [Coprothermobacter proteolyticus DSM 5265]|uniref:Trehalose/maltose transport inner membrane protein n=2 Tax=cellular organisms TaxID=131567 RepID=B5Y6C9_COPPD|nr:carbohydrate ABC transporter permease [Coprothermobacter proteolyticus]ACI16872.1 sugar ABC transporter permease [Coprothermobacter proteolyticus DSM 5265]